MSGDRATAASGSAPPERTSSSGATFAERLVSLGRMSAGTDSAVCHSLRQEMIRPLRVVAAVAAATARPSAGGVDLDLDRAGVASRALRRVEPECPRPCLERHDSRIRSDLEGAQPLCVVDRYGVAVDDRAAV